MFQSLDLFGLSCLFFTVTCQRVQIPPPQNVSLKWFDDFQVQLSWAHPPDLNESCKDFVELSSSKGVKEISRGTQKGEFHVKTNKGFLQVSIKTVCDSGESLTVHKSFTYPELVQNLECNIHSSTYARCSWIPVSQHSPSFFYKLINEGGGKETYSLKACPLSTHDGRTGCDLHENVQSYLDIGILINETRNNKTNKNIFRLKFQVKPPALNWTVTNAGNEFIIKWTPPGLAGEKFIINYTECNENKMKEVPKGRTSYNLPRNLKCGYTMMIKAQNIFEDPMWETPWSIPYKFDADTGHNALLAATIITPLLIVSLAALLLVCWRKNKNSIFPKVPEPRDLLSDISDNNNKINVPNLYIPAEEEENCKITLVVDPQNNKTDS